MSRRRNPPRTSLAAESANVVRCRNCRVWKKWRPIIPTWNPDQGGICVLCKNVVVEQPEPVFSFGSMDEMFAKKIAQVESWLSAINVMSQEADMLESAVEKRNADIDSQVAMADVHGPLARGMSVSRESWGALTLQQKREYAISDEEKPRFAIPASLAAFYRAMVVDKPRLLLELARLRDRSDGPLLTLWEQRHEQPSGVYTGIT